MVYNERLEGVTVAGGIKEYLKRKGRGYVRGCKKLTNQEETEGIKLASHVIRNIRLRPTVQDEGDSPFNSDRGSKERMRTPRD